MGAVGIDVEPAEPLPQDMLDLVARDEERRWIGGDLVEARRLFAAKEAVYKASFALDRTFLEFHDIAVMLANGTAKTATGRRFALRSCLSPRIVVLAVA